MVTGASKGLGAAVAREFGNEGASVVVKYAIGKEAADHVAGDIVDGGGTAIAIKANMREPAQVEQLFAEANRIYGRVDILVSNAGEYDFQLTENTTLDLFRRHFELKVFEYLLAIKEAVRYMPEGSSIVNIGSTVTISGPENASVYPASKRAIDGLTRALSNGLAPPGIRVNAAKLGVVPTEGLRAGGFLESDLGPTTIAKTPLGRLGLPDDVAPAVVYLASDESSWTTDEFIILAGGCR